MARGRNRHQNSKNCNCESVPTQTGQEEEIASPLPSPRKCPKRGIPEEKEGMSERNLSKKTPPRHTSLQRRTPDNNEGIYPADTSRKDHDSQTASEEQSKMIFMGHQILSCHVPVVWSSFIFWKTLLSSQNLPYDQLPIHTNITFHYPKK
jgi:hypothetical protein